MAENDLDAADSLISKAESLGAKYGPFYMGDTPKKARHDLERKRNAAAAEPAKPSRLFSPFTSDKDKKAPATDPFAGRNVDSQPAPYGGDLRPLPRVDGTAAGQSPLDGPYPTTQPGQGDVRAPADHRDLASHGAPAVPAPVSPLRAARLALAVGDVRRADEFVGRAKAMRLNYQPQEDNPEQVEAVIRKYQDLSGLDKNTEAYARMYARSLMDQADGLARWGEFDEAERLAGRAANIRIVYGPFEQKPQELLERIAAARRGQRPATAVAGGRDTAPASSEPGYATASSVPGYASASAPAPTAAAQQRGVELVRQAREAIAAGQLDRAESFAQAAARLRLPDAAFGPGGDRPALVLLDIRQMRGGGGSGVVPAGGQYVVPAGGNGGPDRNATRAFYDANNDPTRNVPAGNQQPMPSSNPWLAQNQDRYPPPEQTPAPPPEPRAGPTAQTPGMALFQQGVEALKAHDVNRALEFFRQAAKYPNDLDPVTAQRLQDHLQLLSSPSRMRPGQPAGPPTLADEAAARQQVLVRQVAADLAHREANARALRETDPKGALAMLEDAGSGSRTPAWTPPPATNSSAAWTGRSTTRRRSSSKTAPKSSLPSGTSSYARTSSGQRK